MVIEWTSPTPVWSDTLRPEPSNLSLVIEAALRANSRSSSSKRKSTTPRRSASRSADNHLNNDAETPPSSFRPSSPRRELSSQKPASSSSVPPLPRRRPLPTPKPRSFVKPNIPTDTAITTTNVTSEAAQPTQSSTEGLLSQPTTRGVSATVWSAEELADVEPMAISYLQRSVVVSFPVPVFNRTNDPDISGHSTRIGQVFKAVMQMVLYFPCEFPAPKHLFEPMGLLENRTCGLRKD